LAGDQTEITEYAINFSVPGNVTLNPPIISVTSRDYSCIVVSDMPVVEVTGGIMTAATPAREDNSTATTSKRSVDVPIYEILLAVCMLAVVYLVGRFR
ncbi:MAG: hypothetical protein U9N46_05630, partial [Euryarchaeota archaeon]|nr:hypothetical protein [Euryarchaeota archaeon]